MTFLYFKLAFAGIACGCLILAADFDMEWQGAVAILVGLGSLCLGIRNVVSSKPLDHEGPYRIDNFPRLETDTETGDVPAADQTRVDMGVTYGLHLIDPAVFDRTVDDLRKLDPARVDSLRDEVRRKADFPDIAVEDFDAMLATDDEDERGRIRESLLLTLVAERSLDMDKSLDRGLNVVFKEVAALAPLRRITEFDVDVDVPRDIGSPDAGGAFIGTWTPASIDAFLAAARPFARREALEQWQDEYLLYHWAQLVEALEEASTRRWHLGIDLG